MSIQTQGGTISNDALISYERQQRTGEGGSLEEVAQDIEQKRQQDLAMQAMVHQS